jgi:hypothetical protein
MQNLLNQVYNRRSMIAPGDGNDGFGSQFGQATPAGLLGNASTRAAATPDNYFPFGEAGLPACIAESSSYRFDMVAIDFGGASLSL